MVHRHLRCLLLGPHVLRSAWVNGVRQADEASRGGRRCLAVHLKHDVPFHLYLMAALEGLEPSQPLLTKRASAFAFTSSQSAWLSRVPEPAPTRARFRAQ